MARKPQGTDIASYLGRQSDAAFVAQCGQAAEMTFHQVRAYTRGHGFPDDVNVPADLRSVIITAGARNATNPLSLRGEQGESYAEAGGADGTYTKAELAILHRYRRMTA